MSDKIAVSTDWLNEASKTIRGVVDQLIQSNQSILTLHMTEEQGAQLGIPMSITLSSASGHFSGSTAAEDIAALNAYTRALIGAVSDVSGKIQYAANLFSEAEQNVLASVNGAPMESASSVQSNGMGEEKWGYFIHDIEFFINNDPINKWYNDLNTGNINAAGFIYNILQLKMENYIPTIQSYNTSITMLDNILARYANNDDNVVYTIGKFTGDYGKIVESGTKVGRMLEDVEGLTTKDPLEKAWFYLQKANPNKIKDTTKAGSIMKGLEKMADIGQDVEHVTKAIERFNKMMSMDPATARDLASGLAQSGDPAATLTALGLRCVNNPELCLTYCISTEGISFAKDESGDILRKSVENAMYSSSLAPIMAAKNASTAGTEFLFGTSDIIKATSYAESVNQTRTAIKQNLNEMINAYRSTPSQENASKLLNGWKAYNELSAEQVYSVQKIAQSTYDANMNKAISPSRHENELAKFKNLVDTALLRNNNVDLNRSEMITN